MHSPWYRSLYWRVALGLCAILALMLAAEAASFLWITNQIAGSMPARSPRRLAVLVASDVAAALAADPELDVPQYVRDQFDEVFQPFVVIMRDGRVAANHEDVPEELIERLRVVAQRELAGRGGRFGRGGRRGRPIPDDDGPPFDGEPGRPLRVRLIGEIAPIVVGGMPVGTVTVMNDPQPFWRVLRELGPTMALVAGGVLLVGTGFIAFIVFGPVRGRLKDMQWATERFGRGDFTARASERGGDEVAALATSFNRMAEELTDRARALSASDKARRQLLADVSHELMTPLTAMRGYIETLSMAEVPLDEDTRRRYLGIVTDETHRLERIIGDLLDLARLEGGGLTLRRERVDVAALFDRVAARHEREVAARGITLRRRVDPLAHAVTGDPDRLEQALQNLAANALRHTPDGGEIALTAEPAGAAVAITVRDTGPGIAPEHLPLIFDRFYKVDASRKAAGGSGLGLSIVKAIVERHGGSIAARTEGGAVFRLLLPSSGHDTAPPPTADSPAPPSSPHQE